MMVGSWLPTVLLLQLSKRSCNCLAAIYDDGLMAMMSSNSDLITIDVEQEGVKVAIQLERNTV
jgi:hypothetical protein